MNRIEYIYTKKDIYKMFNEPKKLTNNEKLTFEKIRKKMKIKPNHPKYYRAEFDLTNNYKIFFQSLIDDEFPEFSAILLKDKTRICRLDYHDSHRRSCKKDIFSQLEYNELHIHLYCEECIKEKLKYDNFVLDVKKPVESFEDFCELFCKIANIEHLFEKRLF